MAPYESSSWRRGGLGKFASTSYFGLCTVEGAALVGLWLFGLEWLGRFKALIKFGQIKSLFNRNVVLTRYFCQLEQPEWRYFENVNGVITGVLKMSAR